MKGRTEENIRKFLLTHLLRGATKVDFSAETVAQISTHAPLARCDGAQQHVNDESIDFYSRTSCEVRPHKIVDNERRKKFLLTHLLRGATATSSR